LLIFPSRVVYVDAIILTGAFNTVERTKPVHKILVADDDEAIRDVLQTALNYRGFEVVQCQSGTQVFQILEKESVDLILLDIIMPGMNGLDVCRKLKSDDQLKKIPIIMITSITSDREIEDGVWKVATPADDFFSKPFDPFKLADRIEKILAIEQ
jgi:CheY-like chemotaxis protein